MARKTYTQTVEPVSRVAEKIFGWLAWIALLAITAILLFFSLVTMNDAATVDNMRQQLETELQNMAQQGENLGAAPSDIADLSISLLNNLWMVALYLAIPLILGLFGLLTMRRRILAGFLLLLAGIFTAPMILGFVTGLIPLFFVIAAILLFVRKDRIVEHDDLEPLDDRGPGRRGRDSYRDDVRDDRKGVDERREALLAADAERRNEMERDLDDHQMDRYEGDTVRRYEEDREKQRVADEVDARDRGEIDDDDIEATRTFRSLGDEDARNNRGRTSRRTESAIYEDRGSNRDRITDDEADDHYVDPNIDSSEPSTPVTEEEYARRGGVPEREDDKNDVTLNDTDEKGRLRNRDYEYDATQERRDNVNRRNNDGR